MVGSCGDGRTVGGVKTGGPQPLVGSRVIVAEGEFAGACGHLASVEAGRARVEVTKGVVYWDRSPLTVPFEALVLQRDERSGGAHAGRRRGRKR